MENIVEKEKLVQNYLDQGDKEAAIKLLFEIVVVYARAKNFKAAEAMRSRIFEIDEMALHEIVRSGEIIEEEKRQIIDRFHRATWANLYEKLSVEEANTLYFSLTKVTYKPGETIFKVGEWKPRLYFINRGRAKVVYFQDGKEIFLKTVEPGQLAGDDTFFSYSLCGVTMIALSAMEVMYLESQALKAWKSSSPVLETKLQSFVSHSQKIADLLKAREIDRRRWNRVNPGGDATVQLMDSSGNPVGKSFKVELCDLSRGGVCLFVRITKRETASLLFGKRLHMTYVHHDMDSSKAIDQKGTVVAVHLCPFEDCAVHVKFDALLPETVIENLKKQIPASTASSSDSI